MGWSFVSVGGGGREGRRTASQAPAHVTPERASEPDDKHFSSIHRRPTLYFFLGQCQRPGQIFMRALFIHANLRPNLAPTEAAARRLCPRHRSRLQRLANNEHPTADLWRARASFPGSINPSIQVIDRSALIRLTLHQTTTPQADRSIEGIVVVRLVEPNSNTTTDDVSEQQAKRASTKPSMRSSGQQGQDGRPGGASSGHQEEAAVVGRGAASSSIVVRVLGLDRID